MLQGSYNVTHVSIATMYVGMVVHIHAACIFLCRDQLMSSGHNQRECSSLREGFSSTCNFILLYSPSSCLYDAIVWIVS